MIEESLHFNAYKILHCVQNDKNGLVQQPLLFIFASRFCCVAKIILQNPSRQTMLILSQMLLATGKIAIICYRL